MQRMWACGTCLLLLAGALRPSAAAAQEISGYQASVAAAAIWSVRFMPPKRESGIEHPPVRVQDLHTKDVVLPRARSKDQAAACVAAWRTLLTTLVDDAGVPIVVGNNQKPFSTQREDLDVLEKVFLRGKGDGGLPGLWSDGRSADSSFLFMEMGAFDGVSESNTLLFERCLNWTGILVEANPTMFPKLALAHRTGSFAVHVSATCPRKAENNFGQTTEVVFMQSHIYTSSRVYGISEPGEEGSEAADAIPNPAHFRSVACTDLSSVLEKTIGARAYPKSTPDLFFLDVEGSELHVLKTLNFQTHPISVIVAEAVNRQCAAGSVCVKRDEVRALVRAAGYNVNPFCGDPSGTCIAKSDLFYSAAIQLDTLVDP
jgi:hypothetical protein